MGLAEAAALVFSAAAAGARLVAPDFGLRAAVGFRLLCIFVQIFSCAFLCNRRLFLRLLRRGVVESRGLPGFGRGGRHGGLDDENGGFETDRRGGFGILEDFAEGIEGQVGELLSAFAEDEGTVGLEIGKGLLELRRTAAPIGDGVAVNAGLGSGLGEVGAAGQGVDDLELLSGEMGIVHGINSGSTIAREHAGDGVGGRGELAVAL